MKKVDLLTAIETKVSKKEFAKVQALTFPKVVEYYKQLLENEAVEILNLPIGIVSTLAIETLEKMLSSYQAKKTEKGMKKNRARKVGERQQAVLRVVGENWVQFPCKRADYIDAVQGAYAPKYFEMNGLEARNMAQIIAYLEGNLITKKDGADLDVIIADLEKQGGYAATNAYSLGKDAISTHNRPDIFPFILSYDGEKDLVILTERN